AQAFAKKLAEQGIHSHTVPGHMKTPQGKDKNCNFLTQRDLEKITENSNLASKESVAHGYHAIVTDDKQNDLEASQDKQLGGHSP
ncbi:hypothetical protein, partial [Legionella sp. ST3F1]|uniref:hypothetical protein n=1 Tax=Legionella sp. ST3F1 TaxID=3402816 RepID=UPI003AF6F5CA